MGTLAETWIEEARTEARTEGLAEGLAEGRAHVVLRQMQRRFGDVPEEVRRRIRSASVPEIDAWSLALLDAPTIDDVMTSACGG